MDHWNAREINLSATQVQGLSWNRVHLPIYLATFTLHLQVERIVSENTLRVRFRSSARSGELSKEEIEKTQIQARSQYPFLLGLHSEYTILVQILGHCFLDPRFHISLKNK